MKILSTLLLLLMLTGVNGQERFFSGTLKDGTEPLLFASVAVLRDGLLIRGTETDITGTYTILCAPGDELHMTYIGYDTKVILVTEDMLALSLSPPAERDPVGQVHNDAFKNQNRNRLATAKSEVNHNDTITRKYKIEENNIYWSVSAYDIEGDQLILQKRKFAEWAYAVDIVQNVGVRFTPKFQLPVLQTQYAQGQTINGQPTYLPGTSPYSFGPKINNLNPTVTPIDHHSIAAPSIASITAGNVRIKKNGLLRHLTMQVSTQKDRLGKSTQSELETSAGITLDQYETTVIREFEVSYKRQDYGAHNYGGYLQSILRSALIQPPSFANEPNSQAHSRGFAPTYTSPHTLLKDTRSAFINNQISAMVALGSSLQRYQGGWQSNFRFSHTSQNMNDVYLNPANAMPVRRSWHVNQPKIINDITYKKWNLLAYGSAVSAALHSEFSSTHLSFQDERLATVDDLSDKYLRVRPSIKWVKNEGKIGYALGVQSLISNNQNIRYLMPNLSLGYTKDVRMKYLRHYNIFVNAYQEAKPQDILRYNTNHQTLQSPHYRALFQEQMVPLYLPNDLQNEIVSSISAGFRLENRWSRTLIQSKTTYNYTKESNAIFPRFLDNAAVLDNVADYATHNLTVETSLLTSWGAPQISYQNTATIRFSKNRVLSTIDNDTSIPIAGFSTVSKNLIKGQSIGVIVGSAYQTDEQGKTIISGAGFPIVSEDRQVIGDPTPLFRFQNQQSITHRNWKLSVLLDGQLGGDYWDGTQQTLDYHGVSAYTAAHREDKSYIFPGVTESGVANQQEVSLTQPDGTNYWINRGPEGVASAYIRDASFLRLQEIRLTKTFNYDIRSIEVSAYALNLYSIGPNRRNGGTYIQEDSIHQGLQYFNLPANAEVGLTIHLKL